MLHVSLMGSVFKASGGFYQIVALGVLLFWCFVVGPKAVHTALHEL